MTTAHADDGEAATKGDLRQLSKRLEAILDAAESANINASEISTARNEILEVRELLWDTREYVADLAGYVLADPAEQERQRTEARGLTEQRIREAAALVRERRLGTPGQEEVAAELNTSAPTLRRAMRELGMGSWPPAPPAPSVAPEK